MEFRDAIILAFKRYDDFTTRSCRSEFWYWGLFMFIANVVLFALMMFGGLIGAGLALLFIVATFVPTLAVIVRRFHDIGISGWWAAAVYAAPVVVSLTTYSAGGWLGGPSLLAMIAVFAAWLIAAAVPGESDDNYWGANPLG